LLVSPVCFVIDAIYVSFNHDGNATIMRHFTGYCVTLHGVRRNRQEAEKHISPGSLMWRLLFRAWRETWLVRWAVRYYVIPGVVSHS